MIFDRERDIVVLLVKIVGKFIDTEDLEILAVNVHGAIGLEVPGSDMIFLVDLSGLVQGELLV